MYGRNNPTNSNVYATYRSQLAYVYRTDSTNFMTTTTELVSGGTPLISSLENLETRSFSSYNILVYDSEYKELRAGSSRDVIGYLNSSNTDSSKVLIYDNSGRGRLMVVYN